MKIKSYFYLLLLLFSIQNCKKDCNDNCNDPNNPNCGNYNPCLSVKPVSADFIMGAMVSSNFKIKEYNLPYIEDSIFSQGGDLKDLFLYFKANETGAKYKWLLGAEVITDSVFVRDFRGVPEGEYSITLIIEKKPNTICFPNDDGKDTLTKSFWILPVYQTPIVGKYKVLFEGFTDSSIVQIKPWKSKDNIKWPVLDSISKNHLSFINFDNSMDTIESYKIISRSLWTGSNIYFVLDETPETNATWFTTSNGNIRILNNNQIIGSYSYLRKQRKFKGRRL